MRKGHVIGYSTRHVQMDLNPTVDDAFKGKETPYESGYVVYCIKGEEKTYLHVDLDELFTLTRCAAILAEAEALTGNTYSRITISNYVADESGRTVKDKKYIYNKKHNRLIIWNKGYPVYENWNGQICRDQDALADCLM